jgi:hypothetical protein
MLVELNQVDLDQTTLISSGLMIRAALNLKVRLS